MLEVAVEAVRGREVVEALEVVGQVLVELAL
jgi:hypothetical protein